MKRLRFNLLQNSSNAKTAIVSADAVTRIRTWVVAATTRSTNHYTITAIRAELSDIKLQCIAFEQMYINTN